MPEKKVAVWIYLLGGHKILLPGTAAQVRSEVDESEGGFCVLPDGTCLAPGSVVALEDAS